MQTHGFDLEKQEERQSEEMLLFEMRQREKKPPKPK
jgi:hypothetical protein